jgi:hypothetical protein
MKVVPTIMQEVVLVRLKHKHTYMAEMKVVLVAAALVQWDMTQTEQQEQLILVPVAEEVNFTQATKGLLVQVVLELL